MPRAESDEEFSCSDSSDFCSCCGMIAICVKRGQRFLLCSVSSSSFDILEEFSCSDSSDFGFCCGMIAICVKGEQRVLLGSVWTLAVKFVVIQFNLGGWMVVACFRKEGAQYFA
jgi:hypothetical protein